VEWIREFEKRVRKDVKSKILYPVIFLIPTRRDRLIPDLVEGRGDLAVGNLTITETRLKSVDFSAPFLKDVNEVLITPKSQKTRAGIADLAGLTVHVRASSSYFESLKRINLELKKLGKTPVKIVKVEELLEDEDLLEMVNAELVPAIIMDSHKADFWSQLFDNIKVHENAKVREGGQIAWAFRKNSPKLKTKLDAFASEASLGTKLGNILLHRYYSNMDWLKKATSEANKKKLFELEIHFRKYGKQYNIDWLILAALAFQESHFDQNAKGPRGAVGLMQIKPSTAAWSVINVPNVRKIESNIHAGTKYLRYLADHYFPGDDVDEYNRILFALASYNAGPERIARLRRKSTEPNIWFNQVENTVARHVGLITVRYVLNIFQYQQSFKNYIESEFQRNEALSSGMGVQ
jgi:membrane-bound lytic murein transglycosylase MltF